MKQQEPMETLKLKNTDESRAPQGSEETTMPSSTVNPRTKGSSETESRLGSEERKKKVVDAVMTDESGKGPEEEQKEDNTTGTEDKAAKIERLKSGFRICKPQGTFLWPSTVTSPPSELVLRLHDLLVAPTPPSVSSSTTSPPLLPTSPVKPLAEKRLVALATLPTTALPNHPVSISMTPPRSLINLNEVPANQHIGDCSGLCSGISLDNSCSIPSNSTAALTYKRRQQGSVPTPSDCDPIPAVSCAASSAVAGTGRSTEDETYRRIDVDARRVIMSSDHIDSLGVSSSSMSPPTSSPHCLPGAGLLRWLASHS